MTESEMRELLTELIWASEDESQFSAVHSFSDAGLMTTNEGLVVRFESGEEFQLTIRRSK